MEDKLIDTFGAFVKISQQTALDMLVNYRNNPNFTKNPDDYQKALIELIQTLDNEQCGKLQKGLTYCLNLSLFKLIDIIENGKGDIKFELSIMDKDNKRALVGANKDNELVYRFWDWIEEMAVFL